MEAVSIWELIGRCRKVKEANGRQIWEQLIKWMYYQFKSQHHINFGRIGNYGYKIQEKFGNKIPYLFFQQLYLKELGLSQHGSSFILKPVVKINKVSIATSCQISKEEVDILIQFVISSIQQCLKNVSIEQITIDLDVLGKIVKIKNVIKFEYFIPPPVSLKKSYSKASKTDLRTLVDRQGMKSQNNFNKIGLLTQRQTTMGGFLPKLQKNIGSNKNLQRPASFRKRSSSKELKKEEDRKIGSGIQKKEEQIKKSLDRKRSGSLRGLAKIAKDSALGWQMMGAGKDPLKKDHDYAKFASDPKQLMKMTFTSKKNEILQSVPIIDVFARTLACPVATQRQNPLVAARIASNLSLTCQSLDITNEGIRSIKIKNQSLDNRVQKHKSQMQCITTDQEYNIVIKEIKKTQQQVMLQIRKKNYNSYLKLFTMIDNKNLAELHEQAMTHILNQIDRKYENPSTINDMITEIVHEYLLAMKKCIIDYILLDPTECNRLNIYIKYNIVPMYGTRMSNFNTKNQNSLYSRSRGPVQNRLIKNSSHLVLIQKIWLEKYAHDLLIILPEQLSPYLHIDEFVDQQKCKIKKIKQLIINDWMPLLAKIYRDQISALNRNQEKCELFFDACAMFLTIQIRTLIEQSMAAYLNYFKQYDLEILNPPQTVVFLQKTENRYQNCFLNVRVSHRKDQIYFMDHMQDVHNKVLSVIQMLRNFSQMIPRPQNLITKTDKHFLQHMQKDDFYFTNMNKQLNRIMSKNLDNVGKCLDVFNKFKYLLVQNRVIDKWILDGGHDRRQYAITFNKYMQIYAEVMENIPSFIRMNMINIDSSELKRYLLKAAEQIIQKMEKSVYELVMNKNNQIQNQLENIIITATSKATDCAKLVQIQTEIDMFRRNGISKLQHKNIQLIKWIGITLYNTFYAPNKQDLKLLHQTSSFLHTIYQRLDKEDVVIFQQRKKMENQAVQDSRYYQVKVKELTTEVEKMKEFGSKMLKKHALQLLKKCRDQTTLVTQLVAGLNERQVLLGMDETSPSRVFQIDKQLKPIQDTWNLVQNYGVNSQSWTKDSIFKQNSDDIDYQTKQMYRQAVQLSNNAIINKNFPLTLKVLDQLTSEIRQFQKNIPIIAVFSNPGLKQRHFTEISDLIKNEGEPLSQKSNLFLNKLLMMGVGEHIQSLEVISETASKEYMIETTMHKIKTQWSDMKFQMKQYKNTDVKILTGSSLQEIQTLIDDHSLKMITMKGSLYAKIFEKQLLELDEWLEYTNSLIEYSAKVQSVWMYLEPVMTSPDILKHLSVEGTKFKIVDEIWRQITSFYAQKLKINQITMNRKLVEKLKQSNNNLQIVMKGLNSYLESKRVSFPRFFFLSNQQLLQILSQTKDPTKVQPHLKKCFEGISSLEFEEEKIITGMYSEQKQFIHFAQKINTALARGNVDQWLLEVEDRMIKGVKAEIAKSHQNYGRISRKQALLATCAMSVLTVQMTNWTRNVEIAIQQQKLKNAAEKTNEQLKQTVELIKDYSKLRKVDIITLEALIVLSVHNLDIVRNLESRKIEKMSDFEWESQMRYYFKPLQNGEEQTEVKILNAICNFNHEYLGNTSRLVITPLTDRCYRTLCSAVFLNYGGAPEGPAGTGKTETVKDLAKALACQCVVFNCSDGLDYKAMGKFFKGLASSGAWSCFDEFNRINLQVLSVVAQQILCIQTAKARHAKSLIFEDAQIRLKDSANCFITMNPGYAGRSQLPDNLKALFRSVAMMIPDYAMIAQISLYSYGFANARSLARKIVSTYKLCSEQLSSQEHYDYGMRAVKSVLVAAGNLKRKYTDIDENSLVLKAINDVNVAKFLNFDIPLFNGITSDLFKDVDPPKINYETLIKKIMQIFQECNLTFNDYSLQKIIQVYDMILVRHGLMVVGYPFSGKTTAIEVLSQALKRCKQQMQEQQVQICRINPKAITMRQLYGYFDEISHQWFDGVLAVKFRNFASSTAPHRKWIVLDGPVDAVWIQNMNTVLDDNKKLCLNSGQIISMSKTMSLLFEPMDLLAASPATVSRCGMIYLEPHSLGHDVLIDSWMKRHGWLSLDLILLLKQFFKLLPILWNEIKNNMKAICYTDLFILTKTFLTILSHQLTEVQKMMKKEEAQQFFSADKHSFGIISSLFAFSVIWSFGASVDTANRKSFDTTLKRVIISEIIMNNKKRKVGYPQKNTIFDYQLVIDSEEFKYDWIKWAEQIQPMSKPKDLQLHNLKIETPDTRKYNYFISFCVDQKIPMILCGPTGTGKTALVKQLGDKISTSGSAFLEIVFSSRTTSTQVSEQIESKLDKKGARSIVGPKKNKMLIYVDDLNMPVKQKYGAQPSIQFLRQLIDQKGFYDFKEKDKVFKRVIDVGYIYSMSALNNDITPRFLRHSHLLSITNFDEQNLNRIFTTILNFSFEGHPEYKNTPNILKYSIQLYNQCVRVLRPTPTKSHYIFNLRDLSKLIIGICRADKLKVHSQNLGRLWGHEAKRIFVDRLLPEDKPIVLELIDSIGRKWGKNMNQVYFSDILSPSHERSYEQISDLQKITLTVTTALNNYNMTSDKPMDLVLFNYALEHILIALRIIRQPKGNALLVGMGGSGRKSFSYLAAFIADLQPFSLEITKNYGFTQFREDIKKLFIEIGLKNKEIAFLFTDSMIKDEQFLQDINNILNLGTVPNLFNSEQKIQICEDIRKDALQECGKDLSLDQLFDFFLKRTNNQLKLIICFSPIGDAFRTRMRMFPSLVNCTTIDWYTQWPKQGLISVATQFMKPVELRNKDGYITLFQFLHSSAKLWSQKFYQEMRRKFYVTPTSFIEFITTFKQLLSKKRKNIKELIYKYENGYLKIIQTEGQVEKMKKSLEEMKPQLKKAAEDTSMKMEMVQIQKEEADQIMKQILGEQKIVLQAVNEANAIKQDCQKELEVALPQLKAAQNALLVLDKSSLTELKAMNNPPIAVRMTMQGLCLLIEPTPKQKMKNEKTLKMQTDWWAASVRLLNNPKLLNQLVGFNKQALTEQVVNNLGKFLNDPNNKDILSVSNVAKSSVACECIIQWVKGMYNFYFVNKKVKPKKESLLIAQEKVAGLNKKLEFKRGQLDAANNKVEELKYQLQWAQKNKDRLEKQYAQCQLALKRAEIIMSSLGSEKLRWHDLSEHYKEEQGKIDVKIFMSAAQIIYYGAFTQAFRTRIIQQWLPKFKQNKLAISQNFSLIETLGNPVEIRSWNLNGLPYDNFSVENGLIIYNSRRWPLMIDPQGQANKWLKKQEGGRKLKVTKPFQDNFIRNLQNSIQFGNPVLIENLGQQINTALTPVLLKQTYKKGATTYLKMGENILIYSQDFYLYMTTKLTNPHYLPEVCTQVVIINFMITEEGLTDQLLALIVSKQRPDLESAKEQLTIESANNQKTLKQIQNKILDILSNSENILADQTAINVLSASKEKSIQISEKQVAAEETEKKIDEARAQYVEVSREGSNLYFGVSTLENLQAMYQYSLTYFTDLYAMAIDKSEKAENLSERLAKFNQYFRLSLYRNIGRSLFQKDRLIFSAIIALKLANPSSKILQYLTLNNDAVIVGGGIDKPRLEWMTDKLWNNMLKIATIPEFESLLMEINNEKTQKIMKNILDSDHPFAQPLPSLYQDVQKILKLIFLKCLRPEKMIEGFTNYVKDTIGYQFVKALPFDLHKIYPDSTPQTPILFILSPGSDPFISITNFAQNQSIPYDSISLGQGQGPIAQRLIYQNLEKGGWVILQNCHLATSWMPSLQKIIEQLEDSDRHIHKNFRLWLTSYPTMEFPQSVLQKSLKITNQPAKGLKNNLMVSYLSDPINDSSFFQGSLCEKPFKKLIYSLSFFHAVIQERRKYGALGWNISYEFNESDLRISSKQIKIYLDNCSSSDDVPFDALTYLIAQCNYGGRVTDQNDRRLLKTLLTETFNLQVLKNQNHNFGQQSEYVLPNNLKQHQDYINYIENLPLFSSPQLMGLHPNADITKDFNESNSFIESLRTTIATSGEGGSDSKAQQEQILQIIADLLNKQKFPQLFVTEEVLRKYPIKYEESMNTVLNQQIGRYNRLIQQIKKTLLMLKKAIKGEQIMTADLEKMYKALIDGKVPELWMNKSYPSLKPLASYYNDFLERITFFEKWIKKGIPKQFWLSGFFFTQSFLTGILQNYSRRKNIPVDELSFEFLFRDDQIKKAETGANIYGLFIEGAGWDNVDEVLRQSKPGQIFVKCPNIYLKPQKTEDIGEKNLYEAPLYKTVARRGVLSTTGHSTNFVMMVKIPTELSQSHWIKRGVALLTQTSY